MIKRAEGNEDPESYGCNCGPGEVCPLGGECQTPALIYQATVDMGEGEKIYVGQTANTFKTRINGHNSDVRTGKKRTALCTYMIEQTRKGNAVKELKWNKIKAVKPKRKGEKMCQLCNLEKTLIAIGPENQLNERSEILQRCRHKDALVLSNNYRRSTVRRPERTRTHSQVSSSESLDHVVPCRPPDEIIDTGRPSRPGTVTDYRRFF